MATIRALEDFVAFQLAGEFKREVYRLVHGCRSPIDLRYRSQLFDALGSIESNLAEGLKRNEVGEFAQFARFAAASSAEAKVRVADGIDRGYFAEAECAEALQLGCRCAYAIDALQRALTLLAAKRKRERRRAASNVAAIGAKRQRF